MITVTAPAKVNLHLEVLGLRSDGFHELAMVMQSIELADRLSFENTADAVGFCRVAIQSNGFCQ